MSSRRKKKSSGLLTAAFIPPVRHLVEADMQLAPVSQAGWSLPSMSQQSWLDLQVTVVALSRSWQAWCGISALPYSRAPELVVLMRCGMIASGWSAVGPWRCRLRLQRGQ